MILWILFFIFLLVHIFFEDLPWSTAIFFVLFLILYKDKKETNKRMTRLEKLLWSQLQQSVKDVTPVVTQPAIQKTESDCKDAQIAENTSISEKVVPIPHYQRAAVAEQVKEPVRDEKQAAGQSGISFLGQKMTTWIAGLAATLGFFYMARYSIVHGLFSPVIRLTFMACAGIVGLGIGCWLHFKKHIANHRAIGEALSGAGLSALYFSSYALSKIHTLAPESVSFILMCLITVLSVFVTLYCGGQVTAMLALIGGFLTPSLFTGLNIGTFGFYVYMFVLSATLLFISRRLNNIVLGLVSFICLFGWFNYRLWFNFVPVDNLVLFVMTAGLSVFSHFLFENSNHKDADIVKYMPLFLCVFFAFSGLVRTNFGMSEWGILGLMLCGLTVLALWDRKVYFPLLAVAEIITVFFFTDWKATVSLERQLVFAGLSALILLPPYIVAWFRAYKEFLLLPLIAMPLLYVLASLIFPMWDKFLPYVGLIGAVMVALQLWPLNRLYREETPKLIAHLRGILCLSATSLITMSGASLIAADFWPLALAVEIAILFIISDKFELQTLQIGTIVCGVLFGLLEYDTLSRIIDLMFFAPSIVSLKFSISDLTLSFYIVEIIGPMISIAAIFVMTRYNVIKKVCGAFLFGYGFFCCFSLYALLQMHISGTEQYNPSWLNYVWLTDIMLLGCVGFMFNTTANALKVICGIGLWRLIGLDLLDNTPFGNSDISVRIPDILLEYGIPMMLMALPAWNGEKKVQPVFSLATAVMSFILVSALTVRSFYDTIDLTMIEFNNRSIFALSAVWLILGGVWLVVAIYRPIMIKPSFGLIYLVVAKVFIYDVSCLDDVWRIAALFGLAGCLLLISYIYSRYFKENARE